MKASRYVVIGIAAIAALLLAFLVRGMIGGNGSQPAAATPVAAEVPQVKVLVAARDLKVGERLTEADLTWKDWPESAVTAAYLTDRPVTPAAATAVKSPEETPQKVEAKTTDAAGKAVEAADKMLNPTKGMDAVLGGVVREEILANEPIIMRKVVRADEGGFMAVMLAPGMRAMAVPVSVENTAGGFILPGDRVDILVSAEVRKSDGQSNFVARPVLRNVKVLAIDQAVQAKADQPSVIGATATLELTPEDGQALAQAKAQGTLSLMLRSYADVGGPSGRVAALPQNAPADRKVTVIRNGQSSEVPVSR
ncbi:Flp pilus assembly protein CpaB [Asticcacaulis sp. BYS171W]|uniref:Flp pilus assembly protein CpaB n=1 Tax=Asticcacaulis aquaticus TaxID=2984212 RepID=A0ABT5HZ13_9CAUL|nr:Flp pilus assembly protein CpaB [Asticcacaulis aquaticus]MDC7685162.1 Flp pilus assembly protein CpaB [Asticcacaulis aquaticus]